MKSEPVYRKDRHKTPKYLDWLKKEAEKQGVDVKSLYSESRINPKSAGKVRNSKKRLYF